MKTRNAFLIVAFASFSFASCSHSKNTHSTKHTHKQKPLPPGHAKKISGSQSAKPHAPGQKKKH